MGSLDDGHSPFFMPPTFDISQFLYLSLSFENL